VIPLGRKVVEEEEERRRRRMAFSILKSQWPCIFTI
jgi:hypothetical protein